jgi:hypothetical protein
MISGVGKIIVPVHDEVRAKDFSIGFDLALDETSGENQRWIEATRPNRSVRRTASVNRIQSVFPRLQAGFSRETSVVNPAAVRGQLEKVLLSAAFARAERMSRFSEIYRRGDTPRQRLSTQGVSDWRRGLRPQGVL